MAAGDEDLRRLREALAGSVADDLPELLAEARAEARARVRAVLAEVMAEAMLEQVRHPASAAPPSHRGARPGAAPEPPSVAPAPDARAPRPASATVAPEPPADVDRLGFYVYGVMAADGADPPDVAGVDPAHPVSTLVVGDLAALVGRVPLSEFNEERLREHLGDLVWVETIARGHEEVLEAAASRATVIPMRLCSIYRDAAGVQAMLQREAAPMRDALRLLAGRAEWAVKVFSLSSPPDTAPEADRAQPDSGAAYLEQRRRAQRNREAADERQVAACDSIHSRLGALAARDLTIALQRPEVSGHDGEMLLNGVYLVDDAALSAFHAQIQTLRDEFGSVGLELVATGPWPAYNFVPDAIGVPA